MFLRSSALLAAVLLLQGGQGQPRHIAIPPPQDSTFMVPNDLQAVSIEFAFFTDYAGNKSQPNEFSRNLLENFEKITGKYPTVRTGGTSQDHSFYYPDQEDTIQRIYQDPSDDQPNLIKYGPSFFESYHTLGPVPFVHGLNLAQNDSVSRLTTAATAACRSIGSQLHLVELGNEWDMDPQRYRPASYSANDYVDEWNLKSAAVMDAIHQACPDLDLGFMAPTFIFMDIIDEAWTAEEVFNLGYDPNNLTRELAFHNYMGVNLPPNPPAAYDLQKTLMNHTNIVENLAPQIQRREKLAHLGHPYVLGELNSIASEGINGETNVFGAALWLVDFSLWAGEHGIQRLHFHQGTDYRYASWQPIKTDAMPIMTRPPYYGQIMVASALGRSEDARIVHIPLAEDTESAYAIYNGAADLSKLVVLNLQAFNQTSGQQSRPTREYKFRVPGHARRAKVERLMAPGSDATDGITFGGVSYDYDLRAGRPVNVDPATEMARIRNGVVTVELPDSSAVLLTFA